MDIATIPITQDELRRVLDIQARAYGALLWLNECAEREPSLLSNDSLALLQSHEGGLAWLEKMSNRLPRNVRPCDGEAAVFVRLLAAFLQTSFRLEIVMGSGGRTWPRLLPRSAVTSSGTGSRKKRIAKQRATARELEVLALADLARENGLAVSDGIMQAAASQAYLAADVQLWTYAHELVRRSRFASQGPAVHRLWRDMSPAQRKRLSVSDYWSSRERLVGHLKAHQSPG